MTPRRVTGDARRWKALSHPLRQEILGHLGEHEAATATTIAEALGENTGTTSYHLRVLADAGVIEEVAERAHGRERWWRTISADHREPDYDSLSPQDRAALDEWRAGQIPGERLLHPRGPGCHPGRVHRAAEQVRASRPGRPGRGPAHAAADVLHPRRTRRAGGAGPA